MLQSDLSKLRVLVADDEPKLRALVARCVRLLGCEVIEARDGEEAWEAVQAAPVDLVVLDVMMPGMSGWEVCRRIKTGAPDGAARAPKVLMLTGIGTQLNEMTSPLFAADDWIDKPFGLDALTAKLTELGSRCLAERAGAERAGAKRGARPAAKARPRAAGKRKRTSKAKRPAAGRPKSRARRPLTKAARRR
jgi:DNA-binding response OmpR family regulator